MIFFQKYLLNVPYDCKNEGLNILSYRSYNRMVRVRDLQIIQSTIIYISMTSLLTHTVAHSTRHSYRPKVNNQPLKKFLRLAVSCVKVVRNGKILTFRVNFLCLKLSNSFYFFIEEYQFRDTLFVTDIF